MFSVTVRDHMMIAHTLKGEVFGPAQKMHGATYVVDVEFRRPELDGNQIVVDIAKATNTLKETLKVLTYKNLDEVEELSGLNTTTEILAKWIFDRLAQAITEGELGEGAHAIASMRVSLQESHIAWAAYDAALPQK
ncbi:MAG: 6-carboxytetrahydropterin synthase [Myxococcota bacterium]